LLGSEAGYLPFMKGLQLLGTQRIWATPLMWGHVCVLLWDIEANTQIRLFLPKKKCNWGCSPVHCYWVGKYVCMCGVCMCVCVVYVYKIKNITEVLRCLPIRLQLSGAEMSWNKIKKSKSKIKKSKANLY